MANATATPSGSKDGRVIGGGPLGWLRRAVRQSWLRIGAPIAVLGAVALVVVVLSVSETKANSVVDLVRVFFGWPVAALLIASLFRDPILKKLNSGEWFVRHGDTEIGIRESQADHAVSTEPAAVPSPAASAGGRPTLDSNAEQRAEALATALAMEQQKAWYWYFMYLNVVLVQGTKLLLGWLANQPQPVSDRQVVESWKDMVSNTVELGTRVQALETAGLAERSEDRQLRITDRGRYFLKFISGGLSFPDLGSQGGAPAVRREGLPPPSERTLKAAAAAIDATAKNGP